MADRSGGQRVLFLAPYLGGGGINIHMLTLGTELTKLGWHVAICSGGPLEEAVPTDESAADKATGGAPLAGDYERAGIAHFEVSFPRRVYRLRGLAQLLRLPLSMWQVVRTVRRYRPALIHSHTRQMGIYARVAQLLTGVPFVSSVHNEIGTRSRLWGTTIGARALAASPAIRDILISDYAVDPARIRVVSPGADGTRFRPPEAEERRQAREHYGLAPEQFVAAFIGALTENKRPDTLVAAVGDVAGSGHDIVALMAGVGSSEDAIRAQVAQLGLADRVRLLGYEDSRRVLWAADALVLPSRSEGAPLVVAEAMLTGVVPVCTPAGAAQLEPSVSGLVFAYGDHEELAGHLRDLIERSDQREAMSARGLERARTSLSSEGVARTIAGLYTEVLETG